MPQISSLARQRSEEAGIEHRIEHLRAAAQLLGKARRRAEDRGDEIEQARIGLEQREELHACRQAREEPVEGDEGLVGIAGAREACQQAPA